MIPLTPRVGRQEPVVKCPRCGENVFDGAPRCGQCGMELEVVPPERTLRRDQLPAANKLIYVCAVFWILFILFYASPLLQQFIKELDFDSNPGDMVSMIEVAIIGVFLLFMLLAAIGNMFFVRWARRTWIAVGWVAALLCGALFVFSASLFARDLQIWSPILFVTMSMSLITIWAVNHTQVLEVCNVERRAEDYIHRSDNS